jgi:hypothetical protein
MGEANSATVGGAKDDGIGEEGSSGMEDRAM